MRSRAIRQWLAAAIGALISVCAPASRAADTPTTAQPPQPGDTAYVKLFTLLAAGPLADTSDELIEFVARNYGWINGHGGGWLKDLQGWEYFAGPSGGVDENGLTVGQRLRALNPEIILTNYRNGAYSNQGGIHEAAEAESRAPLAIAVYDTGCALAQTIGRTDTRVLLYPPVEVQRGQPDIYPFKKSTTDGEHSIDKSKYVAWLRLDKEILRIDGAEALEDGMIALDVRRGAWGTKAAKHKQNARVLAPVYCGSVRPDGAEYYLSGLPDGTSDQRALRYIMMQDKREFWELLADKSREAFDEGYNGPWYDCTISSWINHANAYGVRVRAPYDVTLKRPLDRETFREYQQMKLDYLFNTFPGREFYVNWVFPKHYFDNGHEVLMFSGDNGHHPISGGAIEMYANDQFMEWLPLMKMQIDQRDNGFRVVSWVKKADRGSDWDMDPAYVLYAYATHLMIHEPGAPQYWGAKWKGAQPGEENLDSFIPPSFVFYDLGEPLERFAAIEEAEMREVPGIYARRFAKGLVLVNPDKNQSRTVSLDEEMYDPVARRWVKAVILGPQNGALLLKAAE